MRHNIQRGKAKYMTFNTEGIGELGDTYIRTYVHTSARWAGEKRQTGTRCGGCDGEALADAVWPTARSTGID